MGTHYTKSLDPYTRLDKSTFLTMGSNCWNLIFMCVMHFLRCLCVCVCVSVVKIVWHIKEDKGVDGTNTLQWEYQRWKMTRRPLQVRWSNEIRKMTGVISITKALGRKHLKNLGETYIQQLFKNSWMIIMIHHV